MSILQFLRIFWARRYIILIAMIASFIGAFVVTRLVQPRYEATARVMMNFLRPDPVTGDVPSFKAAGPYFEAQIELLKDYRVTGGVVDAFGWLSDPGRIQAYQARPQTDTRDFRRWLSQSVADSTKPKIAGTVLEITYSAPDPVMARLGAETLRQQYLNESLKIRRDQAAKDAAWYNQLADRARAAAEQAELVKSTFERENGIIMQGRDSDLDSERLAALANQAAVAPMMAAPITGMSGSAMQLAQIDAQILDASKRLGPNHPEMQELRTRRQMVAQVVDQERQAAARAASGETTSQAITRALEAQKSRVIGQREKVERLRQLQTEVDLRREQYRSAAARAQQFFQETAASDAGLTPIGVVITPKDPAFPNKPLMLGGSLALGFGLGISLALLLELLNRRVRGVEDLHLSEDVHCIGVVEEPNRAGARRQLRRALSRLVPQSLRVAA
jgi:uncharacterized protein involved in exopolysaccharide biosynthesis